MKKTILKATGISKSFSHVPILKNVDFELDSAETHILMGENGAGKSTLMKIITGVYQQDKGNIYLDDGKGNLEEIAFSNPKMALEKGISMVFQEFNLMENMTIAENIFMGYEPVKKGLIDWNKMNQDALKWMEMVEIDAPPTELVENLSTAQKQCVEIAKCLSHNAKIIILDEPTSSLSEREVRTLFKLIAKLKKEGISIIYISHRMEELFRISDRITVIRDGTYVGTKKTVETNANELVAMMVGRDLDNFYVRDYCDVEHAPIALEVKNLSHQGTFEDISFSVHKGEILGFAGLVGAGRSEIMEAVFGARPYDAGQIFLNGDEVHFKNPMQAIKSGIALVPEDRKKQGLVLGNSVAFNLTLSSLRFCMNGIAISEKKRDSIIEHYSKRLRIKAASPEIEAGSLSGGNQQKVVLGKWLATKPDVLILDEPTRGVDVNAKYEIYTVINELAKEGIAIIMVSSELPEIINMCDNVCVIRAGKLVGKLGKDQMNQEEIMKYAAGGVE